MKSLGNLLQFLRYKIVFLARFICNIRIFVVVVVFGVKAHSFKMKSSILNDFHYT